MTQSFVDEYGDITVEEAIELCKAAEEFCSLEATAEGGE